MQNTSFMVFPMPKLLSVMLQHIVVFILYLPARPAALRYTPDILLAYAMVRYPTVLHKFEAFPKLQFLGNQP
jgi:hypothetical protein